MVDGEYAVFFRNNHFSTLVKEGVSVHIYLHTNCLYTISFQDKLYLLVTDAGYLDEKTVVWESLQSVSGESHFVDATFTPTPLKVEQPIQPTSGTGTNNDASDLASPQQSSTTFVNNRFVQSCITFYNNCLFISQCTRCCNC
jgi:hypothetical protein